MQAEIGRQVTRMCRFPILEPQKPERGGSEVHLRMISKGGGLGVNTQEFHRRAFFQHAQGPGSNPQDHKNVFF